MTIALTRDAPDDIFNSVKIPGHTNGVLKHIIRYKYILLIILISLLYLFPFFQKGFPVGHDNVALVARAAARIKAISDGQFPVRWAADFNYGYGSPGFIFYYSLPDYLVAILYYFGFGLESSYKLLMMATFILIPVCFYFWAREIFNERVAFLTSILYGFAPYSFLDTFVRIHLGESLALLFVPLCLLYIERNNKKVSSANILFGAFLFSLFINSHAILSFIFSFIFLGYIVIRSWNKTKVLVANLLLLGMGLLLSSYFLIPALVESKYINSFLLGSWYKNQFLNLGNIIYSPWGFGSNVNDTGGLSAQIGPVHFLLAILSIELLIKKATDKKTIMYWLSVFFIGFYMSLSISNSIWNRVHLLQQFQFPWRFTSVSFFSASVLAGYFITYYKNPYVRLVILLSIVILGVSMAKFSTMQPSKSDNYYFSYAGTASYHNEATTIWTAGDAQTYPDKRIELISGTGLITAYTRTSNRHTFQLVANEPVRILDNTVYFPGWQVTVDGKKVPIEFQDTNYPGLITFYAPKGASSVSIRFTESPIRLLSDIMSIVGIFVLGIGYLYRKKLDMVLTKI